MGKKIIVYELEKVEINKVHLCESYKKSYYKTCTCKKVNDQIKSVVIAFFVCCSPRVSTGRIFVGPARPGPLEVRPGPARPEPGRPAFLPKGNIDDVKTDTLEQVAEQITKRGGKGVAVFVDHSDDAAIEALFKKIDEENKVQLDILVNNAYAAVPYLIANRGKKFYELDAVEAFDIVHKVGLRSTYISTVYATRLLLKRKTGLIVNISSFGGAAWFNNVAYGIVKTAIDRLSADTALELAGTEVSVVSFWPGAVKTELIVKRIVNTTNDALKIFENGESTEYSGKIIAALYNDPQLQELSGSIVSTDILGRKYSILDKDGTQPAPLPEKVTQYLDVVNTLRKKPLFG